VNGCKPGLCNRRLRHRLKLIATGGDKIPAEMSTTGTAAKLASAA
jgi:hypothetical protein